MKRKLMTLLLAGTLSVSMLAGCGGGSKKEDTAAAETKTETADSGASETKEEAPAEEAAPEEETATETEGAADEGTEEAATEDTASTGGESGTFSLLDVSEDMIEVGVYGNSGDGLELVFSLFTGPDGNKYASLFGFNNNGGGGDVICGQYEASSEVDEQGDNWTYFDVTDVYTGKSVKLGIAERPSTNEVLFFDEDGAVVKGEYLSNADTINYMASAVNLLSQ